MTNLNFFTACIYTLVITDRLKWLNCLTEATISSCFQSLFLKYDLSEITIKMKLYDHAFKSCSYWKVFSSKPPERMSPSNYSAFLLHFRRSVTFFAFLLHFYRTFTLFTFYYTYIILIHFSLSITLLSYYYTFIVLLHFWRSIRLLSFYYTFVFLLRFCPSITFLPFYYFFH